jgi:hypothetical protein
MSLFADFISSLFSSPPFVEEEDEDDESKVNFRWISFAKNDIILGISLSLSQFNSLSLLRQLYNARALFRFDQSSAFFSSDLFLCYLSLSLSLVEDVFATNVRAETEKEVMLSFFSLNDVSAVFFWREEGFLDCLGLRY